MNLDDRREAAVSAEISRQAARWASWRMLTLGTAALIVSGTLILLWPENKAALVGWQLFGIIGLEALAIGCWKLYAHRDKRP